MKPKITFIKFVLLTILALLGSASLLLGQENVWNNSWQSCEQTINPIATYGNTHWILYEFHSRESIQELKFWNANRSGESNQGVNQIAIDYFDDDNTWKNLGTYNIPQAPESSNYQGYDGPSLEGRFITKLLITVLSNHGDPSCASIAELKINIDENSCYGVIDECGNCDGPGQLLWYEDADGDGLGNQNAAIYNCDEPTGYVSNYDDLCDNGILGWKEVGAIFEENGCTGCHFPGGEGGLDLTTYETFLDGGDKCGINILTGTTLIDIIQIPGYDGCDTPINIPNMNARVGDALDGGEIAAIGKWITDGYPEYCQCPPGAEDTDGDGVCDAMDFCPSFDNAMIGTACDDGDPCTENDIYAEDCNCLGTPLVDSDEDGVCDVNDVMPNDPCTADGTIDGVEPYNWNSNQSNDCDGDGINTAQGDLDDFQACIDDKGFLNTAECLCDQSTLSGSGSYVGVTQGEISNPENCVGLPDGILSGSLWNGDVLQLQFPYMRKGEEICIAIGFQTTEGGLSIGMNDIGNYHIYNQSGPIDYEVQEHCVKTIEDGPQLISFSRLGGGGVRIDGTRYQYCPCDSGDPFIYSPECACPTNDGSKTGTFDSENGISGNAENGAGYPDGQMTGTLGYNDELNLDYGVLDEGSKICVTVGFSESTGIIKMKVGDHIASFQNATGATNFELQEFCFAVQEAIPDAIMTISEIGFGTIRVDGTSVSYCKPCTDGDKDTDEDGICDLNDSCPLSATDDSDGDLICDDMDICPGFDDMADSDSDGVPDGCDICSGSPDNNDADGDGVPDGCDLCPGEDDTIDSDGDGLPDGCDASPCMNFIAAMSEEMIVTDKVAHINIRSNGTIPNSADVMFKAGFSIDFLQGFSVEENSNFDAEISGCLNQ